MKKYAIAILGALAMAIGICSMMTEPASALGACGRNYHRNARGLCVWGGQNQNWCLRHRGHTAVRGPRGTRWC